MLEKFFEDLKKLLANGSLIDNLIVPMEIIDDVKNEVGHNYLFLHMPANFNAGDLIEYRTKEIKFNMFITQYDEPVCPTKPTRISNDNLCKLGSIGLTVNVSDYERYKTDKQFKKWLIKSIIIPVFDFFDYMIITNNKIIEDVTPEITIGVQGIASDSQIDQDNVNVFDSDVLDKNIIDSVILAPNKPNFIIMNKTTLNIIKGLTDTKNNQIYKLYYNSADGYYYLDDLKVFLSEYMPLFEDSTKNNPALVVGNYNAYEINYAKNNILDIGNTLVDSCRNNDVYSYIDSSGAVIEINKFALLYITASGV